MSNSKQRPVMFKVLARAYIKWPDRQRKGPWWIMATFRLRDEAYKYWDHIPACWEARLMQGTELLEEHPARIAA